MKKLIVFLGIMCVSLSSVFSYDLPVIYKEKIDTVLDQKVFAKYFQEKLTIIHVAINKIDVQKYASKPLKKSMLEYVIASFNAKYNEKARETQEVDQDNQENQQEQQNSEEEKQQEQEISQPSLIGGVTLKQGQVLTLDAMRKLVKNVEKFQTKLDSLYDYGGSKVVQQPDNKIAVFNLSGDIGDYTLFLSDSEIGIGKTRKEFTNAQVQEQVLQAVNKVRKENDKAPLVTNTILTQLASGYAKKMSDEGFYSHTHPDGTTFADRIKESGYNAPAGENIAKNQRSVEKVMEKWMASPGHKKNILRDDFTEIGIGYYNRHWVQIFGAKK